MCAKSICLRIELWLCKSNSAPCKWLSGCSALFRRLGWKILLQDEAEADALNGGGGATAGAGEDRTNGGAHGGGSWVEDGRWGALRRRGHAAGWLLDPSQVAPEYQPDAGFGDVKSNAIAPVLIFPPSPLPSPSPLGALASPSTLPHALVVRGLPLSRTAPPASTSSPARPPSCRPPS